jgi:cytidylate kinase
MAIVIISSVDEGLRRELAESLARMLDCPVLSREKLVEQATESGVPVGRLEMAVLKQGLPKERLARHKAQYLAFVTSAICEQSRKSPNLVYHGRAGNLLLQGISHVLRVRVVPNAERRLARTMTRLNLSREKTLEYITQIDQDIANWVHFAHGVDMNDPYLYDLMLNLEQIGLSSASATTCAMAQLPEFQPTPASRRIMDDLCLATRARERLGRDERTAWADLNVSAREGQVTVTYMPAEAQVGEAIPASLAELEGARQIVSTMAVTNLMWVAESFDPLSPAYSEITDLAHRWGAAVELVRLILPETPDNEAGSEAEAPGAEPPRPIGYVPKTTDATGGIEEDIADTAHAPDGGIAATSEALIHDSLFGGSRMLMGGAEQVVHTLRAQPNYSLVVVGEVFLTKGESSRVRLARELCGAIREGTRVSVLNASELRRSFLFDKRQILSLAISLAAVAVIYALVFNYQQFILNFLGGPEWESWRFAATLAVAVTVPVVAALYGSVAGLILKWLRFE